MESSVIRIIDIFSWENWDFLLFSAKKVALYIPGEHVESLLAFFNVFQDSECILCEQLNWIRKIVGSLALAFMSSIRASHCGAQRRPRDDSHLGNNESLRSSVGLGIAQQFGGWKDCLRFRKTCTALAVRQVYKILANWLKGSTLYGMRVCLLVNKSLRDETEKREKKKLTSE